MNVLILPMLIPLLAGILLVFPRKKIKLQRSISLLAMLISCGVSIWILQEIGKTGVQRLDFGGWKPPYGILFVADSFSMLLVTTTCLVGSICLMFTFSSIGEKLEQMYIYPFMLIMVAGVNGSFLTGDVFNLFVCFEVLLIASYVLIALGGKRQQLKASVKYVAINILSSWLFLVGIGYLYGSVGTLNMAHISQRVAESGQTPLFTAISILLLLVFSIKAGLLLYFWLPGSYGAPPPAIAAFFGALLTKVGIYAIFRIFTLIFYHQPQITHTLIGILAIATLIGGGLGAIAYSDIRKILAYNVIIAVGFIMSGLAIFTVPSMQGSVYYLIHDMIAKALLFLIGGIIIMVTGTARINRMSGLIGNYPVLGVLFFLTVLSLSGIPPFPGFLGKVLIGQGAIEGGSYILLACVFLSSLLVLYSLIRIFLQCFWGETIMIKEEQQPLKRTWILPCVLFAALSLSLGVGAEAVAVHIQLAAEVLMNPQIYIDAVMTP